MTFSRFSVGWASALLVPGFLVGACGDDGGKADGDGACEDASCAGAPSGTAGSKQQGMSGSGGKGNPNGGSNANSMAGESGGGSDAGAGTGMGDAGAPTSAGAGGQPPVLSANGEGCDQDQNCESGYCTDGVCCESSCDGACSSCHGDDTGGDDGKCLPVSLGNDPDEECAEDASSCSVGTCDGAGACQKAPDGSVCREKAGDCDVAELCEAGKCDVDLLVPAQTTCREKAGDCDVAEACDGSSSACPVDEFLAAESVCRPSAGPCDVADLCSGASASCEDVFVSGAPQQCGDYKCQPQATACATSCDEQSDCAAGAVCHLNKCVKGKRMFVTSTTYSAIIDGVGDADARCQARATAGGLSGTFLAWLSKPTNTIANRSSHFAGPYYRLEAGVPMIIANSWDDLVDGVLVAIATDEFGTVRGYVPAFTGTEYNGTSLANNCQNWNSTSAQVTFAAGNSSAGGGAQVGANWSSYWSLSCDTPAHYFCIEQ